MTEAGHAPYGFGATVSIPYADAVTKTKAALQDQGFGVLTEIDIQKTMKEKRGIDFPPYVILGACNPPLAERALKAEPKIGLLLPCNVIVYEADGVSVIEAMDPEAALGIANNPALREIAAEVKDRLRKVIDALRREEK